jgi:hypothetical protein
MYEWLIVLTTLVFSEIFKHRKSVLSVISLLWIAAGLGNLLVIQSRTQPFVFNDILMLGDAIRLTTIYYTVPQIIAMYGSSFSGACGGGLYCDKASAAQTRELHGSHFKLSGLCGALRLSLHGGHFLWDIPTLL